jgi:hypothetical protein
MNIIEAVKAAEQNQAIMCLDRNEWLICSGGQLRWKSNRLDDLDLPDSMFTQWGSQLKKLWVRKFNDK